MDLSSLFGPPTVFLTQAQLDVIAEVAKLEGTTGVGIAQYDAAFVGVVRNIANAEGGRAIPGESTPTSSTEILADFFGNVYPSGTDEEYEAARAAASEATAELRDEVHNNLKLLDAQA